VASFPGRRQSPEQVILFTFFRLKLSVKKNEQSLIFPRLKI